MYTYNYYDELYHYGVKGMRWGHRKAPSQAVVVARNRAKTAKEEYRQAKQAVKQAKRDSVTPEQRAARRKKALKIGAAVAGTALAAYGAYKVNQYVKTKNGQIAAKRGYEHAEKMFATEQREIFKSMTNDNNFISKTVTLNANSGHKALDAASRASKDNFRTAAKNVIDYKRSGGDLKRLRSVGSYANDLTGSSVTFGRRRD